MHSNKPNITYLLQIWKYSLVLDDVYKSFKPRKLCETVRNIILDDIDIITRMTVPQKRSV